MAMTAAERVKAHAERKQAEGAKRGWVPASLLRLADEMGGLDAIAPALDDAKNRAINAEAELAQLRRHWAVRLFCQGKKISR